MVIYIALRVPHKQPSKCKDAWIRGLPATNSIPVKKRKSLELRKLSKFTTKSQIEPRLCCVFPHLGLGDPHWVSPISGKGSSQEILGFLGLSPIQVVEWSSVLDFTDLDLDCQHEVLFF